MESKYYTPSIEEFYSGFEYEYLDQNKKNPMWIKSSEFSNDWDYDDNPHYAVSRAIDRKEVRVKYLDKEDIESLGFGDYEPPYEYDHTWTKKDTIRGGQWEIKVWFNQYIKDKQIEPKVRLTHMGLMFFHGNIKNLSELKVLLKQLGING